MSEFIRHREAAERQRRATEEAASWYLDQQEGLDESQRQAFLSWLRASPLHGTEYLAIAQLHGDLVAASQLDPLDATQLCSLAADEGAVVMLPSRQAPVADHAAPVRHRWLRTVMPLCAAALVAAVGLSGWLSHAPQTWEAFASAPDAVREATLGDGTTVQLDRDSLIAVSLQPQARRIDVVRGGALFDVAHDPARPLSVRVGANELQDIGTVFDAHHDDDGARVTVISGRVKISQRDDAAWVRSPSSHVLADLTAGQQATLHGDGSLDLVDAHADLARSTAWLPADIRFERESVAAVAHRFNAYNSLPLHIEDARIGATLISGRFHARDMDAFVAYLRTLPDVQVIHGADDIRVVRGDMPPSHAQAVRKNS